MLLLEKKSKCMFLIIFISMLLMGCETENTPPNIDYVSQIFHANYDSIKIVVTTVTDMGFEDVHIEDSSGYFWADFGYTQVTDETFLNALKELLDTGMYKGIYKKDNTIYLRQWEGVLDIGCGVAYSIDPSKQPRIQYLTELEPLSTEGWFYYVDDYNNWRATEGYKPD